MGMLISLYVIWLHSACYHRNKFYKDGQSWVIRQPHAGPDCYECTCVSNQTKCVAVGCPNVCPNPVYEPDKCCPTCRMYFEFYLHFTLVFVCVCVCPEILINSYGYNNIACFQMVLVSLRHSKGKYFLPP